MIKDDFFGMFCGVFATWTDLLVVMELGREGGSLMRNESKIVALETELTQIWWQDGEEGCRSQCGQAQNQGITWLLLQIQRRVILSLLPAMHMMYPVSIITTSRTCSQDESSSSSSSSRRRKKKKEKIKEIWTQTQYTAAAQLILSSCFNEAYY